ncbi:nitrate reductase molybdenum cofactor assembly chaperone [Paenibacillus sp. FSL W7-1287]|uniref:nitrate reductase molybdenum cofactor assembly chaperone n=1 Tax=Paenibacillus sp. FSL W7-1287 TaxID=2954538 RepID=UPI0030F9FADB
MIDLKKLAEHRSSFGFFAEQLAYPDKRTFSNMDQEGDFPAQVSELITDYWETMKQLSLDEIQERYVETFDFQKDSTLYMTYVKFEDAKERGQMLELLKSSYELNGMEIADNELPDYLPLMCEFIYAANWEDSQEHEWFQTMLAVMEDGSYALLQALQKQESPYAYLIKAFRETFKLCLQQEVDTHEHA